MTAVRRFRALYGAGPLHLLALLASFAITGAAVAGWFQRPRDVVSVLEWFVAAIVIHDLVLLPLYSLLDRIAFGALDTRVDQKPDAAELRLVSSTPYMRVPAILSGLLLAVFFPVIFGLGAQTELAASGIAESGYLARWLLATGAMFAVSGVAYAAALARAGAARQSTVSKAIHRDSDSDQAARDDDSPASDDLDSDQPVQDHDSPTSVDLDPDHATQGEDLSRSVPPDPDQSASGDGVTPAQGPD